MIGYLQGEILDFSEGRMLVGIGDRKSSGTVGYFVSVPQSIQYRTLSTGQKIELHIYSHVREDAFDLYGFVSKYEKELFLTLLSVNGIGPKSALGILSSVEPGQLVDAITQGDQGALTRIPGIGKKTAERVIVELKDTVRKKLESGALIRSTGNSASRMDLLFQNAPESGDPSILQDARSALLSLGYREPEVHDLLRRIMEDPQTRPKQTEDLIKSALRQLA